MKYIIALLIFLLAVGTAIGLYSTSPKTKKAVHERPVPLVQTAALNLERKQVFIEAFGTVIPAKRITMQSEVEGRIISQHPELVPGGLIYQDDVLIQIDPAEYELKVNEYMAELQEATFELDLEQGKQVIAQREWELMEDEIDTSGEGKSLALREPHLRLVRAKVEKAKNRLAAAELALKRTSITTPFNAIVLKEFVDRGQLVSRQTNLATLVGTDQFWIRVSVPVSVLHRISYPDGNKGKGSDAQVLFEPVSGSPIARQGQVLRMMGDLDPEGRMARLIIGVDDPLDLGVELQHGREKGRLLLGSYVKVSIHAGFFDAVYEIPRHALREGDVIWVMDKKEKLQIRQLRVVWRLEESVLARADLMEGDSLILSRLQSPLPGTKIMDVNKQKMINQK
jgi:RND family efflux transporter MFP subunit